MKNILVILLLIISTSCAKITKSGPYETVGKIIYREHQDEKIEYCYHYGYNILKGKTEFHFGNKTTPEKNIVAYTFFNDTITTNDKYLCNKQTNDVRITFFEVYRDYVFFKNKIIKVE